MNNVEKLDYIGQLGSVRQRLGAENENDESVDDNINQMSNRELIAKVCGWELGDESWWNGYLSDYEQLNKLDEENQ